jgi:hypothetical protein
VSWTAGRGAVRLLTQLVVLTRAPRQPRVVGLGRLTCRRVLSRSATGRRTSFAVLSRMTFECQQPNWSSNDDRLFRRWRSTDLVATCRSVYLTGLSELHQRVPDAGESILGRRGDLRSGPRLAVS